MLRSPIITVMIAAARKAARSLVRDFGEVENLQVSLKGPSDFVSSADRRAEDILYKELNKARPTFGFVMEERGKVAGSDPSQTWVVDPLDGTTNFLHGIPQFSISIAAMKDETVVAGLVFNPVMDELYVAERGRGGYVNERRLRVAGRRELSTSVICCGVPHAGRRWTWPSWPPAASTASGSARSRRGISPPECCSYAKPAASSPTSTAAPTCSPRARCSPVTNTSTRHFFRLSRARNRA